MSNNIWEKPKAGDKVSVVFGGDMKTLLPERKLCEDGLSALEPSERREWIKFQQDWFFKGLPADTVFRMKDGIVLTEALGHLAAIQASWEPKHEHKEAAVAWLASLWFESVPDRLQGLSDGNV